MWDQVFAFLNQGWVGLVGGTTVAIVTFFASKRRAAPRAHMTASHELTWGNSTTLPPGFELKFQGKDIPRIARGGLRFWNGGNETLSRELVPSHDRIRLVLPDGEFLLVGLPKVSNPVNRCSVEQDPKDARVAYLDFEFLDPNEGAMVGFLHSSSVAVPAFRGTVKGHKIRVSQRANRHTPAILRKSLPKAIRILPFVFVLTGLVFLGTALFPNPFLTGGQLSVAAVPPTARRNVFLFVAITYIALGSVLLWARRRPYPKSLEWTKKTKPPDASNDQQSNP
jgi:hypothetical protein